MTAVLLTRTHLEIFIYLFSPWIYLKRKSYRLLGMTAMSLLLTLICVEYIKKRGPLQLGGPSQPATFQDFPECITYV